LEDLGIWLNWVSFDVNDIGECLRFILNIIILIAKNLVIVVIFWNYESVEIWLNWIDFFYFKWCCDDWSLFVWWWNCV
jgi:hypothetical protein